MIGLRAATATAAFLLMVSGCSAPSPAEDEAVPPPVDDGTASEPSTDCVADRWSLVVDDYRAQSEAYLLGLGIPIEDFGMTGSQVLTLTSDGLLQVETDLTSTGRIVAGTTVVPFSITTLEVATADWAWTEDEGGDGTIAITNFAVVESEVETPEEAAAAGVEPPVPALGEDAVLQVDCDGGVMELSGAGPLTALWVRD